MSHAQCFGWEPAGSVPTVSLALENGKVLLSDSEIDDRDLVARAVAQCSTRNRYLLVAALMVRNEAQTIIGTLQSLRKFADALVVLDTGSSDDTLDIVRGFCDNNSWPCSVFERRFEPFDFSKARNHLLERCAEARDSEFLFLADAHDSVHGAAYLRSLCAKHVLERRGAVRQTPDALGHSQWGKPPAQQQSLTQIRDAVRRWTAEERERARTLLPCHYFFGIDYVLPTASDTGAPSIERQPMVRLIRTFSGWRYSGPVHEVLWNDWWLYAQRVDVPPDKCKILQDKRSDSDGSQRRWPRDLCTIDAFLRRFPAHPQALYYRGKTLRALRKFGDAVQSLAARLRALPAANDQAVFQRYNTHYMLAECLYLQAIGSDRTQSIGAAVVRSIEEHCWQAFALRQRVEPLLLMAKLYLHCKQMWRMLSVTLLATRLSAKAIASSEAYSVTAYEHERDLLHQKALELTKLL